MINNSNLCISDLKNKIAELKSLYGEIISNNSNRKIFLFCLESFNFQIKLFSVDSDNLNNSLILMSNRIYCDYYKLMKILLQLFADSEYVLPELQDFPIYNDLRPMEKYSIANIETIYSNVCLLLDTLIIKYKENENKINQYSLKSQTGICIINLIQTMEYDNSVLKDQIMLYIGYLNFFYKSQKKYLTKLLKKISNLKKEIDSEVNLENTSGIIKTRESSLRVSDTMSEISFSSQPMAKKRKPRKQPIQMDFMSEVPTNNLDTMSKTEIIDNVAVAEDAIIENNVIAVVEDAIIENNVIAVVEDAIIENNVAVAEDTIVGITIDVVNVEDTIDTEYQQNINMEVIESVLPTSPTKRKSAPRKKKLS